MVLRSRLLVVLTSAVVMLGGACGGGSSANPTPIASKGAKRRGGVNTGVSRKTERGTKVPDVLTFPEQDLKVAEVPAGLTVTDPVLSAAGQRIAFSGRDGTPYLDGALIEGADTIRAGRFSANGQYFAYIATPADSAQPSTLGANAGREGYVVIGGEQFGPHQRIELLDLDDDGKVQFLSGRSGNRIVYNDDVAGPVYQRIDRIDLVRASPRGRVVAYRGVSEAEQCVVVDGDADCYAMVGRPVLSPNGKRVAYTAAKSMGTMFAVVDGKANPQTHAFIDWRIAVSDAGRVAYVAQTDDGGRQVSIDGKLGPRYDRVVHLTQAPTGDTVAYAARKGSAWHLVVDTTEHAAVDGEIKDLQVAAAADAWAVAVRNDEGIRVVTPGGEGPYYRAVTWLTLSPKGTAAYVAKTDTGVVVVVGAKTSEAYDEAGDIRSLSSGAWAYVARRGTQWLLVSGDETLGPYDDIGQAKIIAGSPEYNYTLSPDGQHLVFRARVGEQWRAVLDGVEGPLYDDVWAAPFAFDPKGGRVGYFARSDRAVWWRMQALTP